MRYTLYTALQYSNQLLIRRNYSMGRNHSRKYFLCVMCALFIAFGILTHSNSATAIHSDVSLSRVLHPPTGGPRLISAEALPSMEQEMCPWVPASFEPLAAQGADNSSNGNSI